MQTLVETSSTPLVTADKGIAIRNASDGDDQDHGEDDPHYLLAVNNASLMAQNVADELSSRFPDRAALFAANVAAYRNELADVDRQMREILAGVANRKLVTMHDAWYYFAEAYGFDIVGSFEPTPGREPTPQYLVELKKAVDAAGAQTLYTEPLIATGSIQSFIQDNRLKVATLDPVEGAAGEEHHYVDIMKANARTIRDGQ
jgi:zinc transport system substrate-binding protein